MFSELKLQIGTAEMGKLLFFFEDETIKQSNQSNVFTPSLSHDMHIAQLVDAAIEDGHDVFYAKFSDINRLDSLVFKLVDVWTFNIDPSATKTVSDHRFDLVFCQYPEMLTRSYAGAKTVGYLPALYMVEMPDQFTGSKFYLLLRKLQYDIDYCIFQNSRQLELMDVFARSIAGVDIRNQSFILPIGTSSMSAIKKDQSLRVKMRESLGIANDEIVLIHGGGAWRWTDFDNFLYQFIEFLKNNKKNKLRLIIPGLTQRNNIDHADIVNRISNMLTDNKSLLQDSQNKDWKILYIEDWEVARLNLNSLFLISDIGVSVSKNTLENYLAHRVRIIDYLNNGLGLLLSRGDLFSESMALKPIAYFAQHQLSENSYLKCFEEISKTASHLNFTELGFFARNIFNNKKIKQEKINEMMSNNPVNIIKDCSINILFHNKKIEMLNEIYSSQFMLRN
jgi:hypothetical protein